MKRYDKYDLIVQILIIVFLSTIYFMWLPMFPILIWLHPNLYMFLGIIELLIFIIILFFIIYLINYYFPNYNWDFMI